MSWKQLAEECVQRRTISSNAEASSSLIRDWVQDCVAWESYLSLQFSAVMKTIFCKFHNKNMHYKTSLQKQKATNTVKSKTYVTF
jgi:hypothetical protein